MSGTRGFPQSKDEFAQDERISFDTVANKYILEDDQDGTEWEWVEQAGKWMRSIDEKEIEEYQKAYAVAGVDENEDAQEAILKKKRKLLEEAKEAPASKKAKPERANTAIYVTSLPLDVTVKEVHDAFSKYGIIAEEVDSNKPRIKLYRDENGDPKGDALIVYFRPESVALAIQMMDNADFRWGLKGPNGPMTVTEADQSYKRQQNTGDDGGDEEARDKKMRRGVDKKKIKAKTERLNQRLANWSDEDEPVVKKESRWNKFVVLKHMFTIQSLSKEMEENPSAKEELLEDVKEQCALSGEVLGLYLYDLEEEGVITARFNTAEEANDCVKRLNGKGFDGRIVHASIANGSERFKKSRKVREDTDSEEEMRLNNFGAALEKA